MRERNEDNKDKGGRGEKIETETKKISESDPK